jgi:hypothetical protein
LLGYFTMAIHELAELRQFDARRIIVLDADIALIGHGLRACGHAKQDQRYQD